MCADLVGITAQLKASLLHNLKSLCILVLRHNTDMSGDNVRAKLLCKIKDSLGFLDLPFIILFNGKSAASEITAKCGNDKSVISNKIAEVSSFLSYKIFGSHLSPR